MDGWLYYKNGVTKNSKGNEYTKWLCSHELYVIAKFAIRSFLFDVFTLRADECEYFLKGSHSSYLLCACVLWH